MTTRLGLIGAGNWGNKIIQTCLSRSDVKLNAVACRSAKHKSNVPDSSRFYTDWRELITAGDIDAVICAVPPELNKEIACFAMEAGLAVQLEKPFTLTMSDAEHILDCAKKNNGRIQVGYIDRHNEAWKKLLIHLKDLGDIKHVHACFGGNGPIRQDIPPLWDWGSHPLALIIELLSMPDSINAERSHYEKFDKGSLESVDITLNYPDKTVTVSTGNAFKESQRKISVTCEKGALHYNDRVNNKLILSINGEEKMISGFKQNSPLDNEIGSLITILGSDKAYIEDARLGLEVTRILNEIDSLIKS